MEHIITSKDTIDYIYHAKGNIEEVVEKFLHTMPKLDRIFFSDGSFFDHYLAFSALKQRPDQQSYRLILSADYFELCLKFLSRDSLVPVDNRGILLISQFLSNTEYWLRRKNHITPLLSNYYPKFEIFHNYRFVSQYDMLCMLSDAPVGTRPLKQAEITESAVRLLSKLGVTSDLPLVTVFPETNTLVPLPTELWSRVLRNIAAERSYQLLMITKDHSPLRKIFPNLQHYYPAPVEVLPLIESSEAAIFAPSGAAHLAKIFSTKLVITIADFSEYPYAAVIGSGKVRADDTLSRYQEFYTSPQVNLKFRGAEDFEQISADVCNAIKRVT